MKKPAKKYLNPIMAGINTHLSTEMQTTTLLDRKSPKIRKNEHILQTKSPAHHETVMAQTISSGIMRNVT